MKTTGQIFQERLHASDPGTGYGDTSREHHVCTATALDYTLVNGVWVPTYNGSTSTSKVDTGSDWIGVQAITASCWLYPVGWGESGGGRIAENGKFIYQVFNTNECLQFRGDGSTIARSATSSLALSTWAHGMMTRTAAGVTNFYINGVLSGSADQASGTPTAGLNNVIVGTNNAGTLTFDGYIWNLQAVDYIPDTPAGFAIEDYNKYARLFDKTPI
jgi:hypothetical protein